MAENNLHIMDKKLIESKRERTPAEKKKMQEVMKWLKANNPEAYKTIKNKSKKNQEKILKQQLQKKINKAKS